MEQQGLINLLKLSNSTIFYVFLENLEQLGLLGFDQIGEHELTPSVINN